MARYEIVIIEAPEEGASLGTKNIPHGYRNPLSVLSEEENLFSAIHRATAFNEATENIAARKRAVVREMGPGGKIWPNARLCTPLVYSIASIWWPDGWEPSVPLDVPNCVHLTKELGEVEELSYSKAAATVRALNQQNLNQPGKNWYVVIALENEPLSQTETLDSQGGRTVVETRRFHAIRTEDGSDKGDCTCCPAHELTCATQSWETLECTVARTKSVSNDSLSTD